MNREEYSAVFSPFGADGVEWLCEFSELSEGLADKDSNFIDFRWIIRCSFLGIWRFTD